MFDVVWVDVNIDVVINFGFVFVYLFVWVVVVYDYYWDVVGVNVFVSWNVFVCFIVVNYNN